MRQFPAAALPPASGTFPIPSWASKKKSWTSYGRTGPCRNTRGRRKPARNSPGRPCVRPLFDSVPCPRPSPCKSQKTAAVLRIQAVHIFCLFVQHCVFRIDKIIVAQISLGVIAHPKLFVLVYGTDDRPGKGGVKAEIFCFDIVIKWSHTKVLGQTVATIQLHKFMKYCPSVPIRHVNTLKQIHPPHPVFYGYIITSDCLQGSRANPRVCHRGQRIAFGAPWRLPFPASRVKMAMHQTVQFNKEPYYEIQRRAFGGPGDPRLTEVL